LRWPGGERSWRWEGGVPADDCVRVATVQATVPDAPGSLTLDLTFTAGELKVTNRYNSAIRTDGSP
jgi:hypothetical protein